MFSCPLFTLFVKLALFLSILESKWCKNVIKIEAKIGLEKKTRPGGKKHVWAGFWGQFGGVCGPGGKEARIGGKAINA